LTIANGEPTHARCDCKDVDIGAAVDAEAGFILTVDVKANDQTETLHQWLQPILDLVDADVLKTFEVDAFQIVAEPSGVEHLCRRHLAASAHDLIAEISERIMENPSYVPEEPQLSADDALEDLGQFSSVCDH
jgi:hypothetical protein